MWFPAPTLTGRWVQLEPLAESHREGLRAAADDERIWQHALSVARGPGFDEWFDLGVSQSAAGQRVAFAVRRCPDGQLIGSSSYLDLHERHRRLEIGATWYAPAYWGTAVNPECKLLLLRHAFEVVGVNRVALLTDVLNKRSQAAIAKLGAEREGILRNHMISQGGRIRDSVLFSITAAEWPAAREALVQRLRNI